MYHESHPQPAAPPTFSMTFEERAGRTHAMVVLHWGSSHLAAMGVAYRHPSDYLASESGEELAAARALSDLADQLLVLNGIRN